MIYIELLFPDDAQWTSVTELVRAESYSEHIQIMNKDMKSVVDTVSFSLKYDQLILAKLLAVQPKGKVLLRTFDSLSNPSFTGYIAPTVIHETEDVAGDIQLEGRDNSWRLDKPLSADLKFPNSIDDAGISLYDSFTQIILAAGYQANELDLERPASPEMIKSINEQKGDITYRALLDSVLSNYGYVLTTTAEGKLTYTSWMEYPYTLSGTVSDNISVADPFRLEKSDEQHDGVKLSWSRLSVLDDVCLYKAQLPIGTDGTPSGIVIPAGGYYPEDGQEIDIYQSYKQDWLDTPYLSKTTREKNKDISLITSDSHHLVIVADNGITHTELFEPKRGKVLFHNPTTEDLKLYVFEIWGRALFREEIRETLVPDTSVDPEKIPADFIFTTNSAEALTKGLYALQQYGDIEYRFMLYERLYEPGERVHISQNNPAIETDVIITELQWTDDVPGFQYLARGISEFGDLQAITTSYYTSKLGDKGDKGEDAVTVEIISHHGTIFRPAVVDTTLEARVYKAGVDETSNYLDADFRWIRTSDDAQSDAVWNSAHYSTGGKTLHITDEDVYGRAVFFCELLIKR